ncbi:L-seryl-tRNA(Sec) kinase [Phytophthora nicotianae]|nr:L-seryl-tRNA(Sec) kinase [Phytophthora nicotianae]
MASEDTSSKPAEFDPEQWKVCQRDMVVRVTRRLEELKASDTSKAATPQLVLLVDDNFQYRSQRKRFFQLSTELNCGFGLVYVNVSGDICRERNASRNKGARVPDETFQRMVTVFEPPNGDQNPWEVNTCELTSSSDVSDIEELMDTLVQQADKELKERRWLHIEKTKEKAQQVRLDLTFSYYSVPNVNGPVAQRRDRLATQRSVLHRVDLQLRQWISAQLQDEVVLSRGIPKAQLASQLNQRRKKFLESLKRSPSDIAASFPEDIDQVVVSLVLRFQQQQE